jgi:hypothetical protein
MGLGPNSSRLATRVGIVGLNEVPELDKWTQDKQTERSVARAFSQERRRAGAAPKGRLPKPRKHKNHCHCIARPSEETIPGLAASQGGLDCCRCKGEKCLKPKTTKKKSGPKVTILSGGIGIDEDQKDVMTAEK